MCIVRERIARYAKNELNVLILGPTGAGKEVVARALHRLSSRADEKMLALNCATLPESLIESVLFGHVKGAFTGATEDRAGHLRVVNEGTLFLDEIGELPPALQAKLLRVLEDGSYQPLGSSETLCFTGRILAATHVDLLERVRAKTFREDLYYRLKLLTITVPALEGRREDIRPLIDHFVRQQSRRFAFSEGALCYLQNQAWPGNVRQLKHVVERAAHAIDEVLITETELEEIEEDESTEPNEETLRSFARRVLDGVEKNKLRASEEALIREALDRSGGNRSRAAGLLGIHRKKLERWLARPPPHPPATA